MVYNCNCNPPLLQAQYVVMFLLCATFGMLWTIIAFSVAAVANWPNVEARATCSLWRGL